MHKSIRCIEEHIWLFEEILVCSVQFPSYNTISVMVDQQWLSKIGYLPYITLPAQFATTDLLLVSVSQ